MFISSASALALSLALATPAFAAEDIVKAEPPAAEAAPETGTEQEIVVTGQRDEYGARSTSTATRTDTPIRDIPQALTVISESQIEDQALRSIADVLTYVPGATPGTGEGNRDQITLRGNNTTADFFVDGIRDDVQYFRDLYNADRIEILRGPNAMIFGRGGGGGVVNRVTKRASSRPYREVSASADSEGGVRFTGDVDQPLAPDVGLRVNGVYEDGESFRRGVGLERYGITPTLGATLGATRLDLAYEYFHDRRTADRGVPAFNDRPLRGADRTFFGDPEQSFARIDAHVGSFALAHAFSDGLTVRNRTQYGDYDKFYQNIYPTDLLEGSSQVRLAAYHDITKRENLFTQTDLVWKTGLGGIDHTLLFGFELGRQETLNRRVNGFFQPSDSGSLLVPLADPTVRANLVFRGTNTNAARTPAPFNDGITKVAALYVQDQLRLSDAFQIVAGLRFDRIDTEVLDRNTNRTFEREDDLVSPRLGLIVKPVPALSLYAGYGRSYLPSSGDQFTSLDLSGEALKPERFDNYEVGAKWEPLPGLLATAALYQLDRTNSRAPGPTPGVILLTGKQRSRGIELGLERNVSDRWQISAGYALQKAQIRTRTTACNPEVARCEVPLVPRHQFSLWNRYEATERLGVGLGVIARSKSFASISNAVTLAGYTRLDAALFYDITDGLEAQLNVENLLGADYFPTAHNDNNIAPGAPTTLRGTLRFHF
jgi:catecholate siderophore receptor